MRRDPLVEWQPAPAHAAHGMHWLIDCHGVDARLLVDAAALRALLREASEAAGARILFDHFHDFRNEAATASGVTGVVLLAESHLAVHTWPEIAAATLDVYVCNLGTDNSARAHAVLDTLIAAFAPGRVERHALLRGEGS